MIALLLACLASEAAETADVPASMRAVVAAIDEANGGDRKAAVKLLDKVIEDEPENPDARVARGMSLYHLGEVDRARDDLAFAFSARPWEDRKVEQTTMTEVATTTTTLDLLDLRRSAAGLLIVLAARDGAVAEGQRLVDRSTETFGEHPQLLAARGRLALAAGAADAWTLLGAALLQPDPTLFVQSVASEMAAIDAANAPAAVTAWLKAAGQWTAHHNAAIGHLEARRYEACAEEAAAGLSAYPAHTPMLRVGYDCASRSDVGRADAWLEDLGGARKVDPWSGLAHARLLVKAKRPDDALELLAALPDRMDGELPGQVEALKIEILLAAGRLNDAARACIGNAPVAELSVGYALINASRFDEAEKLLDKVCPALRGQTAEGSCEELRTYAASR